MSLDISVSNKVTHKKGILEIRLKASLFQRLESFTKTVIYKLVFDWRKNSEAPMKKIFLIKSSLHAFFISLFTSFPIISQNCTNFLGYLIRSRHVIVTETYPMFLNCGTKWMYIHFLCAFISCMLPVSVCKGINKSVA